MWDESDERRVEFGQGRDAEGFKGWGSLMVVEGGLTDYAQHTGLLNWWPVHWWDLGLKRRKEVVTWMSERRSHPSSYHAAPT